MASGEMWRLADSPLAVHGLFVGLGTLAAVVVYVLEARRRHRLDDQHIAMMLGALICGGVAARLSTLWRYLTLAPEPTLWGAVLEGGQSVLGGLAGAYAGAVLTKRLIGYRGSTGDVFAPAVALGIGIGRFGCLLTEPPGTPTQLPWGISVSAERAALFVGVPQEWVGVPLHPSFAYEIAFHLLSFVVLRGLRARPELEGELFKLYLLAYALFRFAVELVRGNPVVGWGLTWSQMFLIPSSLLLIGYFIRRRSKTTNPLETLHV